MDVHPFQERSPYVCAQTRICKKPTTAPLNCLSMYGVINQVLGNLRDAFSREIPFRWFGTYVSALLFNDNIDGIQSMVNRLDLCDEAYDSLDGMYRSRAINLQVLRENWLNTVVSLTTPLQYFGRCALIADGVKKPKEGRKMPGVCRLHNNSETQSKPSSYHGVQGGYIGILVKGGPGCANSNEVYCIPLSME